MEGSGGAGPVSLSLGWVAPRDAGWVGLAAPAAEGAAGVGWAWLPPAWQARAVERDVAEVSTWLSEAHQVVALTGAGISTGSGIPDYRGPNGLWTKDPRAARTSSLSHYLADGEVRRLAWRNRLSSPVWGAVPNPGHAALVALERAGHLSAVVTQNVDELHQRAGHDPARVLELHGTMFWSRCWSCGDRRPMAEALARVRDGEDDPRCRAEVVGSDAGVPFGPDRAGGGPYCGGVLRSDTISFGQALDPAVLGAAQEVVREADLVVAIGSSLTVQPAAGLVPLARRSGARVVIVNAAPTRLDAVADAVVSGEISVVLPALVARAGLTLPAPAAG